MYYKQKIFRLMTVLIVCSMVMFSTPPIFASEEHSDQQQIGPTDPDYQIIVKFDQQKRQLHGTLQVEFTNHLNHILPEIFFNVWGNADEYKKRGGGVTVDHVRVNGQPVSHSMNQTILKLKNIHLAPQVRHQVSMQFTVSIPEGKDRFGWHGKTISLGNWFPILAVYDQEGWNTDPYFSAGESFYSLTSDFDVRLQTDPSQVIATTGTEMAKHPISKTAVIHHFQAKNVRDFAIEMDSTYRKQTKQVGSVRVNVYSSPQHEPFADDMMKGAVESLQLFNEKFGEYPWPELDVVSMEGWFGGMEYPGLVMISLHDQRTPDWVRSVVAHEVAHQWFYGLIGNNQFDEPWLDESFASFAAALYDGELDQLQTEPVSDPDVHLSSPVSVFMERGEAGTDMYYQMIYDYGARTLNDLRKELGDAVFYSSLRHIHKQKQFDVLTTHEFIHMIEEHSGKDLSSFFRQHRIFPSDQRGA